MPAGPGTSSSDPYTPAVTWLTSLPDGVLVVGWLQVSGQPIDTVLHDLQNGFFSAAAR